MSGLTWKEVTAAPEWENLPPDQRAQVRDKFFGDVIAPNIPDGTDPNSVRADFLMRTSATMQPPQPSFATQAGRWVGRAAQAAGSRALDLGATLNKGLNPAADIASQITGVPTTTDQLRATSRGIAPAPAAAAANDVAARSADMVGGLIPDAAAALFTGGASEAPEALSIGSRLLGGARSMFLPGAENTRETYDQSIDAGATPLDAAKRAAVAGGSTLAMGALPASVAGGVVKRIVSGAAIGAGTGEAQRAATNAVSPDTMQQGFDLVSDALSAIAGGTFGGVLGHRASLAHGDDLFNAHGNVTPVSEDPASHDITPAQPVDTSTAAMIDPDNRVLAAHTQRVADLAQQMNLNPDQAQAVTRHLAPAVVRDPVTGFYTAPELTPTLQAAQAHVEATGEPARYAELDVRNLGGLNAAIGHTAADNVLRDLAQSTHAELQKAGAQVIPVRRGGDEISYVVRNGDADAVQAALDSAQAKAEDIAKAYGVDAIPHPKGGAPGVGVVTSHAPIMPGQDLSEMFRSIDRHIESQKGELQNGNATTDALGRRPTDTGETADVSAESQPGEARAGIRSAGSEIPALSEGASGEPNAEAVTSDAPAALPAGLSIAAPDASGNIRVSGPANQQYAPLLKSLGARVGASVKGQHWTLPADREPALREALAPHAAQEQAIDDARPAAFTTAKGSTYVVHNDGTTTRNKAFRPEHGADEQGPQPRSDSTFYVTPQHANLLGEFQTQGGPRKSVAITPDGKSAGVRYLSGRDAGKFESRTVAQIERAPRAGLTPVETWNAGSKVHFGNEITAVHPKVEQMHAAGFPTPNDAIKAADKAIANRTSTGALHDFLMKVAPMAASGDHEAQAVAKDFANEQRLARWEGAQADKALTKQFSHTQLENMWSAADSESVLRQQGKPTAGAGLDTLRPNERAAVEKLQADANDAYAEAKQVGIIGGDADPLPSYVPRMIARITATGAKRFTSRAGAESAGSRGVRTFTANLLGRKHLTADETEAAAKAHDDDAEIVRNIRTLPLATSKLREAIAGRKLINAIEALGKKTGVETVVDSNRADDRYFTLDNPAFTKWVPRLKRDDASGKMVAVKDADGNVIFDKTQLKVLGTFEGPLRAVMSEKDGAVYRAFMALKQKSTSVLLYSPLIHQAVEWGRALPAMPGKVLTFRVYFDGARAKNDPATMREAISAGLAPIGHGSFSDIEGIANTPHIAPGRSWTSKILSYPVGLFDEDAGTAVKRWVDKAGDFYHGTLLWDQIASLQMGLYSNFRDSLIAKGMDSKAAQILSAHLANRYSGALPKEATSNAAKKLANLVLFSRTFTLGNAGALKDVLTGLPKDAQAQILRDAGAATLHGALKFAKRKALATVLLDIGLMYVTNSLFQSSIAIMSGASDLDKETQGYLRRMRAEFAKVKENPLELLHAPAAISATAENEPGKQDRVLVGHAADGTAVYMRNPLGKVGEDLQGWLMSPLETAKRKLSMFAQPALQTVSNDQGFGRKVYDDQDQTDGASLRRLGRIATLFIGAELPTSSIQAAVDYYKGDGNAVLNVARVVSPLAGVTFSKGAPGGEAVGEMYRAKSQQEFRTQEALPDIRKKIQSGDVRGAMQDMTALGMSPSYAEWVIKTTVNPSLRLSSRGIQEFMRTSSPEQRARMQSDLDRRAQ